MPGTIIIEAATKKLNKSYHTAAASDFSRTMILLDKDSVKPADHRAFSAHGGIFICWSSSRPGEVKSQETLPSGVPKICDPQTLVVLQAVSKIVKADELPLLSD
jgi:hypothetical protein